MANSPNRSEQDNARIGPISVTSRLTDPRLERVRIELLAALDVLDQIDGYEIPAAKLSAALDALAEAFEKC